MKPAGYYLETANSLTGVRQATKATVYPTFESARASADAQAKRLRSFVRVAVVAAGNETVVYSVRGES